MSLMPAKKCLRGALGLILRGSSKVRLKVQNFGAILVPNLLGFETAIQEG